MMTKILDFIKANLLVVISVALIVILIPVGWFFSSGWNASIKQSTEEAYNAEKRKLTGASNVDYSLPAVLSGEGQLSESRPPNKIVTDFYKEQKAQRETQVAEVLERGTAFNRGDHDAIVDGLLPEARDDSELRRLGRELAELIAGTDDAPSYYARLLRRLNGGDAPDPVALASSLNQYEQQQLDTYKASSADGNVSAAQQEQLERDLISRRLGEYAGRAESLAFYCPLSAIHSEQAEPGYSQIPSSPPPRNLITSSEVYRWTWDAWVVSDVLSAVALANTDSSGVSLSVPKAPIKHVELIRVNDPMLAENTITIDMSDDFGSSGRGSRGSRGSSSVTMGGGDPEPGAPPASFTGRTGGVSGAPYDIRYVELTVVASSKGLPRLIDALGKTNYMTVIDLDLSRVDVWDQLQRGYYYGDEHVVRARLTVETVWLRSWTSPLMPASVKRSLGVAGGSDSDG